MKISIWYNKLDILKSTEMTSLNVIIDLTDHTLQDTYGDGTIVLLDLKFVCLFAVY